MQIVVMPDVYSLVFSIVVRSMRKLPIYSTIALGVPFLLRSCRSLLCETLSNAPATLSSRTVTIFPLLHALNVHSRI